MGECNLVVDRVKNLSGSGWLASHGFGFGFIGFQPWIDIRVYRVFGFEKVTKITNFFTIFLVKKVIFGRCRDISTKYFQISIKIVTLEDIFVQKCQYELFYA